MIALVSDATIVAGGEVDLDPVPDARACVVQNLSGRLHLEGIQGHSLSPPTRGFDLVSVIVPQPRHAPGTLGHRLVHDSEDVTVSAPIPEDGLAH